MKIGGRGRPACGRQAGSSPLEWNRHVSLFVIRRLGRVRAGDFELAGDLFDLNVDQVKPAPPALSSRLLAGPARRHQRSQGQQDHARKRQPEHSYTSIHFIGASGGLLYRARAGWGRRPLLGTGVGPEACGGSCRLPLLPGTDSLKKILLAS